MRKSERKSRPHVATLSDVRISRQGDYAIIDYRDQNVSTVHLDIGPQVKSISDEDILEMHNSVLRAQSFMAAGNQWIPIEIPPGSPQIKHHPEYDNYLAPRGGVLRCLISDGGPDGETTVIIDDDEYSMEEFGVILRQYNGWGMRVVFVDEDAIEEQPEIEVRDVEDN